MSTPRIEIIRKFQGSRSQKDFARDLGVSETTLSRVLAEQRGADFVLLQLLSRYPEHAAEIADAIAAGESTKEAVPA
jgi:DNA-binding transcriptional regulator YiaG